MMRLSYLALDSCCSWIVNQCCDWASLCLAHSSKESRSHSAVDGFGFDECDSVGLVLLSHLRSQLPTSLVDDIWLHLLHDFCPLIADRNVVLHAKKLFQPPVRGGGGGGVRGVEDRRQQQQQEDRRLSSLSAPASPLILSRFFTAGDEDSEVVHSLDGVRHLELIHGIWELQGGQLSHLVDVRFMQENPIFADLNAEDDDDSDVDSESSSSSSSEESSSESDGDNEKIKLNVPKHYNVDKARKKKPVCFPDSLTSLHISSCSVSNFPALMSNCLYGSPTLALLCLSDLELRVWFFDALLSWSETLSELHLFRCPLVAESVTSAHQGVLKLVELTELKSLSLVSCEWANAIFRLRFPKLTALDVSLDLVSKVSQTRAARDRTNNAGAAAPAAVPFEAAADVGEPAGGGGGGGDGQVVEAERRPDEVVDRWALFGFVERNSELRYLGLVNHTFSQLEEVKNGQYGSRNLSIGGASSAEQMLAALQHHSGTHYLGVWGAKVRQQILKYTLTDCFTLTSQMRIIKSAWSFADRDLLLFSLGDRFRRLNVNDEKRTKIVSRILLHVFSQLKTQPRGCGHDFVQLIRNCRIFIFAPNCLAESVLIEMWSTLFTDYTRSSSDSSIWYMVYQGNQFVDTNPNKTHLFVEFLKRSTIVISSDTGEFQALSSSMALAYDLVKYYLSPKSTKSGKVLRTNLQLDYECLLLLWMFASSDAFGNQFIQDFPLFLPRLRHFVKSNKPFLEGLDLLATESNVSLPDGDVFIPVWGILLHLLIKVPSSPFIFTVVESLLQRCWSLLQLPEISPLLALLSIGILIFAEPERRHENCGMARPFYDQHPKIIDFLDHCLRMWSIQRGTLTSGKHIAFGFALGDSMKDFLGQPYDDPSINELRFLRSRFADLAIKVFHPGFSLFPLVKEGCS